MEKNIITQLQNEVTRLAKANGTDVVGFASADRFEKDDPIFKIMPETKTVIGLGFRILRGIYRGIEEGSTYYQYTTMAVENMEETVMPMAQMRISMMLEENDFIALPQRRHQQIMAEHDSTNPEVAYDAVYRDKTAETQMDFVNAAVKCGLGEKGFDGTILNDDFGPMFRYCFILTDAEFEPTDEYVPHLCDNCGKCAEACPGHAIDKDGIVDPWQCIITVQTAQKIRLCRPMRFRIWMTVLKLSRARRMLHPKQLARYSIKYSFIRRHSTRISVQYAVVPVIWNVMST